MSASVDPYHAVQSEIQSSLQTADQLRASFVRIRSTARTESEELQWAQNEVCHCFSVLGIDIIRHRCRTDAYAITL